MKIIPLSEGSFTIDKTKIFIPFNPDEDKIQSRTIGSLLVEVQPFVVITSKDILLLDTGLGFSIEGQLQIHKNLIQNGIHPGEVTKVLLSHLHKDHSGGVSILNNLGHHSLSFPNATYYFSKDELDYAYEIGFPGYMIDEISQLNNHEHTFPLEKSGTIDDYIQFETVGGHCPYHLAFWIRENDEVVFFGGDVAPQLQQMKSRFAAKYDFDGKKSMELRQQWWQQGLAEHWIFLFYHDIKTPSYTNKKNGLP